MGCCGSKCLRDEEAINARRIAREDYEACKRDPRDLQISRKDQRMAEKLAKMSRAEIRAAEKEAAQRAARKPSPGGGWSADWSNTSSTGHSMNALSIKTTQCEPRKRRERRTPTARDLRHTVY